MTALDDLCPQPFDELDNAERALILSQLADTELFVRLTAEPINDQAEIFMVSVEGAEFAVACDLEDRLSGFWGGPVAYAAMPGRILAEMLARDGKGLLVNPGTSSEMLLGADSLEWLSHALSAAPVSAEPAMLPHLEAPVAEVSAVLEPALANRLTALIGLAGQVSLVGAAWADGRRGHLLLVSDVAPDRRAPVAKSLAEMLSFLPEIVGGVDIAFAEPALPEGALRLDVPAAPAPQPVPKRDPNAPPRLR